MVGLLLLATAAVLPLSHGEAIPSGTVLYELYLLSVGYLYFGWCWTRRRGQTLGMKTWKVRVRARDGGRVGWGRALARYTTAIVSWLACGLGFVWVLLDRDQRAWHDRASGTVLERVRD